MEKVRLDTRVGGGRTLNSGGVSSLVSLYNEGASYDSLSHP